MAPLLTLLALATSALPASAMVEATKETFTGSLTGLDVEIRSDRTGTRCVGRLVFSAPAAGSGSLACDDGRSGRFSFQTTPLGALGYGSLGGKALSITFG